MLPPNRCQDPRRMTRAAIYARYSSELSNEKSAEDQARVCRELAERNGWQVVEIYSDLAISGTNNRRPGLIALMADADAGRFDVVVAEALDRIARHQADIATIYQRLEFAGVRIFTLSENEVSEIHIGLLGTMNALYVKELKNKIRRGQKGAVARGRVSGGKCYGYDAAPVLRDDGTVDRGHRRINEAQAAIVRRIFAEYIGGISPREISHRLNREGVPSASGGEWKASSIIGSRSRQIGILHNPIYVGRFVWNRVTMVQDPETRRRVSRVNAASERVEQEMEHLRIIDDASWAKVQGHLFERNEAPVAKRRRPKHLFSGLVRCRRCGASYTVINRDRWGCTRHREAGTCDNGRRIATPVLEDRVLAGLKHQLLSPDAIRTMVKVYHEERARIHAEKLGKRSNAERDLAKGKEAVQRLVRAVAEGGGEFAEIREALAKAKADVARAEADLAEFDAVPVIALHPQLIERYRARIAELGRHLVEGENTRLEALPWIRSLIDVIEVDDDPASPDNASVVITGSLDAAIGLANGREPPQKRTVMLVAEERYSQYSATLGFRRFKA
jgi:site-specific DNA recombinase